MPVPAPSTPHTSSPHPAASTFNVDAMPEIVDEHVSKGDGRRWGSTMAEKFARLFGPQDYDDSGYDDPSNPGDNTGVYEVEPTAPDSPLYGDGPPPAPYPASPLKRTSVDRPARVSTDGATRRYTIPRVPANQNPPGINVVPGSANLRRTLLVNSGAVGLDVFAGDSIEGAAYNGPGGFRLAVGAQPLELIGTYRVRVIADPAGGSDGSADVLVELDLGIPA